VAALDLNRRVPDGKSIAKSFLQVSHHMLSLPERAVADDHVNAQRRLFGREGPYVEVVHAADEPGPGDFARHRGEVYLGRRPFHKQVHRLTHDPPGAIGDENGDGGREQRVDV